MIESTECQSPGMMFGAVLLPYHISPDLGSVKWFDGAPAWALRDEQELTFLLELADAAAIRCIDVGQRTSSPAGTMTGEVLVFEPELHAEAQRYAHVTRRRLKVCSGRSEIALNPDCEIVFATREAINAELIQAMLSQASAGSAMAGLICVTPESSGLNCLAKAIAAMTMPRGPCITTEIYSSFEGELEVVDQQRHILGRDADQALIRSQLRSRNSLVAFDGHSDGVDATLSDRTYLCAVRESRDVSSNKRPVCLRTAHCRRLNLPLEKALQDYRIIDASDVRAHVVVWSSCWGAIPQTHTGLEFGLGLRLGTSKDIGALLIACGGPVLQYATTSLPLVMDLTAGLPAGHAVHRHNTSPAATQVGHQMILMGDPRCTATAQQVIGHAESSHVRTVTGRGLTVDSRVAMLEMLLSSMDDLEFDGSLASNELSHFVQELSELELGGAEIPAQRLAKLQNWVLAQLELTNLHLGWFRSAVFPRASTNGQRQCTVCRSKALVSELVGFVSDPRLSPRSLVHCPRCGVAADRPWKNRVRVGFDASKRFVVEGISDLARAMATVVVFGQTERLHIARWPAIEGRLARSFRSDAVDSPEAIYWYVVVLDGIDLCLFNGYVYDIASIAASSKVEQLQDRGT